MSQEDIEKIKAPEEVGNLMQSLWLSHKAGNKLPSPLIYDVLLPRITERKDYVMNQRLKDITQHIEKKIIQITGSSIEGSDKWLKIIGKRKKSLIY